MPLAGEALDAWIALHDGIEKEIALDGRYESIKPFASKAAEHSQAIVFRSSALLSIRPAKKARPLLKHLVNQGYLQVTQYGRNKVERAWEVINHD